MNGHPKRQHPLLPEGTEQPLPPTHHKQTGIDPSSKAWQPRGKKQPEPILGFGAGPFLAQLIVFVAELGLLLLVLLLGGVVKKMTSSLIFGQPHRLQRLPPGSQTVIDGYTITVDAKKYDEGVAMDDVLALANQSKAKNKVVILDCCHSGAFGTPAVAASTISQLSEGLSGRPSAKQTS
ncbi:hypothetical protein ACVWXM_001415 [Bradyrhizobium sp. GM7.3]